MQGLKYPLTIAKGSLVYSSEYQDLVGNAIISSLKTRTEERVMRPEYGREDEEFQSISSLVDILARLRRTILVGLEGYDGVSFELSGWLREDGLLDVSVLYRTVEGLTQELNVEGVG